MLALVALASAAMAGSLALALRQRDALERESERFMDEQRIADRIVALTYQQQLEAYRYFNQPEERHLAAFHDLGDDAYAEIRRYLFHELSADARLHVEQMKEAHQEFEVASQRAFDLAKQGQVDAAIRRLESIDARVRTLDSLVSGFLDARAAQRAVFQREHGRRAHQLNVLVALFALGLAVFAVALAIVLRRRVLTPLGQLTDTAQLLRAGDPMARMPEQEYAEFDSVAEGFNQMAESVQTSRETMEAQNEELQQTLDHLQQTQSDLVQHEKLSAMGQMLAGLAHELNNPLAGLLGFAEELRQQLQESPHEPSRALGRELALPLEREALRARSIVRNLLDFARKPTGTMEPVSLADTVGLAVGLRAHAFALAGKTLRVDISPDLYVFADVQKLQHSFVNLINNALDALVSGGGHVLAISASAEEEEGDGEVRLLFEDDGPGFADPVEAFAPFYTTKQSGKGTGLGLSLVRKFITESGGFVSASNGSIRGARVSVRLRAATRPPAPSGPAAPAPAPAPAPPPAARSVAPAGAAPRVLVVDDEPTIREVQRRMLTRIGVDVVLAASGEEARDVLERERIDLVISDLRMPGAMDGAALLGWMRTHRPDLAERMLFVTGDVSGLQIGGSELPPERLLSKPFMRSEYLERVRNALSAG